MLEIPDEVEVIIEDVIAIIPMADIVDISEVTEALPIGKIEISQNSALIAESSVSVGSSSFIDNTSETEPNLLSVSVSDDSAEKS